MRREDFGVLCITLEANEPVRIGDKTWVQILRRKGRKHQVLIIAERTEHVSRKVEVLDNGTIDLQAELLKCES